jgi:hypothetical protein
MRLNRHILWVVCLLLPICSATGALALADSDRDADVSVVQRIEATAKKVGDNIEKGFTKAVKKIEEKHIGEKVERKLKKAVTKTEEGFKKAGKKLEQKFGS